MIDFSIVSIVISAIMLIVSVLTFTNASKQRHEKSAAEQAQISIKLDSTLERLVKIENTLEEMRDGLHENEVAIEKLETRVTGLEGRVKKIETNLKTLENNVHNYHSK